MPILGTVHTLHVRFLEMELEVTMLNCSRSGTIFRLRENDNNGNFQWSSINNMLNTAYNNGARTHTNSWGSSSSSDWGVYTSTSEDVDDRARYYDQYCSGREGLTVLSQLETMDQTVTQLGTRYRQEHHHCRQLSEQIFWCT